MQKVLARPIRGELSGIHRFGALFNADAAPGINARVEHVEKLTTPPISIS